MGFLPEWYTKGTTGIDNSGGFGTANMFTNPKDEQVGHHSFDMLKNFRLAKILGQKNGNVQMNPASPMPQSNTNPQMTPYQDGQQTGPNMGQVNNPYIMSPNGQMMPNWNRTYGGY